MINFAATRIDRSVARAVAPAAMVLQEGQALVADLTAEGGVAPSAGASGEQFVGVSLSQQRTLSAFPAVEEFTVPATPYTVTLAHTPIAATMAVETIDASGNKVAAYTVITSGTVATTQAKSVADTVAFYSDAAGLLVRIRYRWAPTAVQAQMLQGDVLPGGDVGAILNSVGVIVAGDVYTSEYDTSVDWDQAAPAIKTGANGLFTIGGSGAALTNARVISRPSTASPYLGIALNNG